MDKNMFHHGGWRPFLPTALWFTAFPYVCSRCSPAGRRKSKDEVSFRCWRLYEAVVIAPKRKMGNDCFRNYKVCNRILHCLLGTQADSHYLNWCIVHYGIPRFNRVSITWNTEMSGAKACTLTHVWRFNPTVMAFLLDTAAWPDYIGKSNRERGSQAPTCKTLLLCDP